ncbi:MAG TPA: threonine synthase [Fulvivirga sp.]|nr:threonine synthase [Fulvivirga sp.]
MKTTISTTSLFKDLYCSNCGLGYDHNQLQTFSTCCNRPLTAKYFTTNKLNKEDLKGRVHSMWRYREMLPLIHDENRVSFGEGMTPIISWSNLASRYGLENLMIKDEGINPTGSFKARGLSMAVSKAKELGVKSCVIPTAGNAGGAMSAYCAQAAMKATVVMPKNTPRMFKEECEMYGAELILFDGLIDECGHYAAEIASKTGAFNMSTLKEPYRLEGKKTMGYEIAEQLNWTLPDVIFYPTGGGTGLIGIWKAFHEMIELGWIAPEKLPIMIAVQSSICAPVYDIFNGRDNVKKYSMSVANGLSVPKAFGIDMIINVLNESKGSVATVSEHNILQGVAEIGAAEGMLIAPEGAAIWEALKAMIKEGLVSRKEKIMLLNTGNGFKYMENFPR